MTSFANALMVGCVNAHDRCYGGVGAPCPYCEPIEPFRDAQTGRFVRVSDGSPEGVETEGLHPKDDSATAIAGTPNLDPPPSGSAMANAAESARAESAEIIARLERELAEAREALEPMLEALKQIVADRDETEAEFCGRPIPIRNSSIDAARAAIAKAQGGSDADR